MTSTTVRISTETRKVLRELAEQLGEPMQSVLSKAVEAYRRQHILDQANLAYAVLRSDDEAWQEERQERSEWNAALADGLEEA